MDGRWLEIQTYLEQNGGPGRCVGGWLDGWICGCVMPPPPTQSHPPTDPPQSYSPIPTHTPHPTPTHPHTPTTTGVQHIALKTDDIFATMAQLRQRAFLGGFDFMPRASDAYYRALPARLGEGEKLYVDRWMDR